MADDGRIEYTITLDDSELKRGANQAAAAFGRIDSQAERSAGSIEAAFKKAGAAIGGYFAVDKIKEVASRIIDVRKEMQSMEVSFDVLLGSQEKSAQLVQQMQVYAAKTPLVFGDLAKSAQTMLGFGISLEQIMPMLKAIGDISMGDTAHFQTLSLAFSQMSATGKLMGQDLLQMINAGFNPLAEISRTTGQSISELKDKMSAGAISSDMVKQAFISATSEGGKFNGMLEKQSHTMAGAYSNLQGAIEDAMNSMGKEFQGTYVNIVGGLQYMVEHWRTVGQAIVDVAVIFGTYKAASMAAAAVQSYVALRADFATAAMTRQYIAALLAEKAQAMFNKTCLSNPYVLAAAAVTALVYAVYKLATAEDAETKARRESNAAWDEYNKKVDERRSKIQSLLSVIKGSTATEYEKVEAYEELKTIVPELTKAYSRQELAALDTAEAEKNVNEQLDAQRFKKAQGDVQKYTKQLNDLKFQLEQQDKADPDGDHDLVRMAIAKAEARLKAAQEVLNRMIANKQQAQEEAKPIEIKIKESRENAAAWQSIRQGYSEAMELCNELQESNGKLNYDQASARLDLFIGKTLNELDDLREQEKKRPLDMTLRMQEQEKTKMLNSLVGMKSLWQKTGVFNIPLTLMWNWEYVKSQTDKAAAQVKSNAGKRSKTTYKQDLAAAREKWIKSHEATEKAKNKTTAEWNTARQAEEEAKKAYEALGGDTSGRQARQQETDRKQRQRQAQEEAKRRADEAKRRAEEAASRRERDFEQQRSDEERQLKQQLSTREAQAEARIAQIKDDGERERAQRQYEHEKNMRLIDEHEREMRKENYDSDKRRWDNKNKDKTRVYSDTAAGRRKVADVALTADQAAQLQADRDKEQSEWARAEAAIQKQRLADLNDYLKQWGDYEQKRQAIAQSYDDKLRQASSPAARASLVMQRDKDLQELDKSNLEETIDWDGIFSELEGHTKAYLQGLAQQLRGLIDGGTLPVDQMAVAQEKLRAINGELSKQSGLFGYIGDRQRENTRLAEAAADAQQALTASKEQEAVAAKAVNTAQLGIVQLLVGNGMKTSGAKLDESLLKQFKPQSSQYKQLVKLLETMRVAEGKLAEARKATKKATDEARNAEDAARREPAQAVADWFADVQQFITSKGIDQVPDMLNSVGLSGAGEKAGKGLSAISNAAGAAADFATGNYIGAAAKGINSILDFGDMLGLGGDSDKSLAKDVERLTSSNKALKDSIDKLSDLMENSSTADALGILNEQTQNIRQSEQNTQELMQRSGAAYNKGRLGFIGGKRSSNYQIDRGISAAEWERASKAAGVSVHSAADFWKLTSEQMYKVSRDAPEVYAHIKQLADDGYRDAATYMDDYIGYWLQLEEVQEKYYEKMSSTTFDSVVDDYRSALLDMDSSNKDLSKNFEKYMQQAIIGAMVTDEYEPLLKEWYKSFATAMEGGMTQAEEEALKQQWDNIVQSGLDKRNALADTFGWSSSSSSQDSTKKGFATASQDSVDELNGRFSAVQMDVAGIRHMIEDNSVNIETVARLAQVRNEHLADMQGLVVIANNNLETIAKNTKELYAIREGIEKIKQNTDKL